ncbi:hypothetical protein [Extibacter muris]|uniref:hypothetical protein n=1 Tax=Extibacter muris TaxID=1796622 RepID=UPI00210AFFC2|nr:hypothetical protein [Extibacter muris]
MDECLKECGIPAVGLKLNGTIEMCRILEKKSIDVLNVSVGMYETVNTMVEPNSFDEGWRSHLVKAVKEKASIPVMGNAVIRHPQFAEKLLEEGRVCEIRKCISCLYCFESAGSYLLCGLCRLDRRRSQEQSDLYSGSDKSSYGSVRQAG